ncbi:hypothetical protein MNBD_ALPHA05-2167 [hydrothermal vent metagenome]|uniref:Uncharacterized protein n=1 Tax=hydrothermal vent metagenome TaxID=652676 RepID=A0A3B0S924_9ZZZZ
MLPASSLVEIAEHLHAEVKPLAAKLQRSLWRCGHKSVKRPQLAAISPHKGWRNSTEALEQSATVRLGAV